MSVLNRSRAGTCLKRCFVDMLIVPLEFSLVFAFYNDRSRREHARGASIIENKSVCQLSYVGYKLALFGPFL